MFYLEIAFYFLFAGIAIVTWERIKQSKIERSLSEHFYLVYLHLFVTIILTFSTMAFIKLTLGTTIEQAGIVMCTSGIAFWFVVGYYLDRI